ncbi:tubulin/FtsZ family protein [Haloprofundus sp. MHR1]|uniref:tubulin/FtsZ family protein n=1 Tax=Haloprofundus sp. MHR1 TaxID=2572921 RepID=UPI0010BE385E|nr:tubulin/FtsZ family protein [Haloprofundus sp. MHR1]QCJ45985.1 cell division protein [Haloprofundus sp. MHR1]
MKLVLVGIGHAGGKIVEAFYDRETQNLPEFVVDAVAFNTARADLHSLERIPESNRYLFGQVDAKGHGVGGDRDLAASLAAEDKHELLEAIDSIPTAHADAFLIVTSLGGGTGSGAASVLTTELQRLYSQPVYGLGVLPAEDEDEIYAVNTAQSLQRLVPEVDHLLCFDNETWVRSGETVEDAYERINTEIARRLSVLFSAGEVTADRPVAESVVDASEIINTLGQNGISAVGYAESQLEESTQSTSRFGLSNLLGSDSEPVDPIQATSRITTTIRKAARRRLSVSCELSSVERVLVVVSGPPQWLNRDGIEKGRQWIAEETGCLEVRGGDYPLPNSEAISVVIVFSGVSEVSRIDDIQAVAAKVQTQESAESEEEFESFVGDEGSVE